MPEHLNLDDLIKQVEGAQLKIRELQQSLEHEIGPGLQLKTWDGTRWLIQGHQLDRTDAPHRWYASYASATRPTSTYVTPNRDSLVEAYVEALRTIMARV